MGLGYSTSGEKAYYFDTQNKENYLGEGAFAVVFKVVRKTDRKVFAAKVFKLPLNEMLNLEALGYERELKIL
jgi:hypothetical protein